MSKEIDYSKPLSRFDKQYLAQRPWLPQTAEDHARATGIGADDEIIDEDDYDNMSVADLKSRIEERNTETEEDEDVEPMSVSGKKADLVARLREDDERRASIES